MNGGWLAGSGIIPKLSHQDAHQYQGTHQPEEVNELEEPVGGFPGQCHLLEKSPLNRLRAQGSCTQPGCNCGILMDSKLLSKNQYLSRMHVVGLWGDY